MSHNEEQITRHQHAIEEEAERKGIELGEPIEPFDEDKMGALQMASNLLEKLNQATNGKLSSTENTINLAGVYVAIAQAEQLKRIADALEAITSKMVPPTFDFKAMGINPEELKLNERYD